MKLSLSKFFQSRLNIVIFRRLHPLISYHYMQIVGRIYYLIRPRERCLIEANIRDMVGPDGPERRTKQIIRESFHGIFLHYFEKLFAAFRPYEYVRQFVETHFEIVGMEILDRALAKGNGAILATAHFGAVEFIPWVIGLREYPIDVIMECATTQLRKAVEEKANRHDIRLYTIQDGQGVLFRALQTLKENRLLMTECDEVDTWHRRKNRKINLFGRDLYFDNTLDILARRAGAPVIGVFLTRIGYMKYRLVFEDISVERETPSAARDTLNLWEKYVSGHPEQWYQWKKWGEMKVAS